MKHSLFLSSLFIFALPFSAQAGVMDGWTGEASLTGSKTTGNTETTDVGLSLKLTKSSDKWRHNFKANADYGRANGDSNKRRFDLGYQIERDFSDRLYGFGNADYYNDDFGAFQEGYFVGAGVGYKVILPDPIGWNLEGGVGFRSQTTQDPLPPATTPLSITEDEVALRAHSDFDYKFNENVSLYNDTEIIYSSSDTYIWNEIGLTAKLSGNLSARASFRVDTHTDVPVGREKTDTITRFGIVYALN